MVGCCAPRRVASLRRGGGVAQPNQPPAGASSMPSPTQLLAIDNNMNNAAHYLVSGDEWMDGGRTAGGQSQVRGEHQVLSQHRLCLPNL